MNTKNIIIIGAGPLPNDTTGIREAAGLRTHQFTKAISTQNHSITLICIQNNDDFQKQVKHDKADSRKHYKNTKIIRLHRQDRHLTHKIADIIDKNTFDIVIGVNTFPSFIAAQTCPAHIPFWADLNGWIMAESQARGNSEKTNVHFANAWKQEKYILDKADRISTVSTAQKFCTIGEMASTGHLKYQDFHSEIVYSFPNTTEFFEIDKTNSIDIIDTKKLFRGTRIPENAIVASHIGGYNNWGDTSTLFTAIDNAMSTCPNLYFVSTGGAIRNVANTAFSDFLDKIDTSLHKDRYIFLGWIQTEDMQKIYKESTFGINCDFACIETETGARNRLNEMLKFQLPIITTRGSEIASDIEKYGAGECADNGNAPEITEKIIKMANMATVSSLQKYKERCEFLHKTVYNPQKIMTPLFAFIKTPCMRNKKPLTQRSIFSFLKNGIWYLKKNGFHKTWNKAMQRFF